jgi:arginase family enzyme
VRVFHFEEVVRRGLEAVLAEALAIVTAGTERFGISIDLDVITPEEVPHVGTPVAGGLASGTLARELERIAAHPALAAVELVEYSPKLDRDGRSARVAVDLLAARLCGRSGGPRDDAQVVADPLRR